MAKGSYVESQVPVSRSKVVARQIAPTSDPISPIRPITRADVSAHHTLGRGIGPVPAFNYQRNA
jgi:hypothetical protein